jgi:predicted permease
MALGIGANSTVFRLFDAAFLRPLGVGDPARAVAVYATSKTQSRAYLPLSYPNYRDLAAQNRVFSGLAAFQWLRLNLLQGERPRKIYVQVVTPGYFAVLGVRPLLGRTFSSRDDEKPGGPLVAVLSHGFWHSELGGDPDVLGRTVRLGGQRFTVVGVMPPGFKGTRTFTASELWLPMSVFRQVSPYAAHLEERGGRMFEVVGRLRPGVSLRRAEGESRALAARLEQEYPDVNRGQGLLVLPLDQASIEPWQRPAFVRAGWLLLSVVGLLLLIACGNVASLLLARGIEQRKEIAIRLSLGARRGHLIRQLLAQSVLLSLAGGGLGLLLGLRAPAFLWRFRPPVLFTADALDFTVGARVVLFTCALAVAAGLLFGLAPALRATRPDLTAVLKEGGVGAPARRLSVRDLLVAGQVALCFLALTGAALFLKSLQRTQRIDPGFAAGHLLVMTYSAADRAAGAALGQEAYHRRVLASVGRLPGIGAAALATFQPLSGGPPVYWTVYREGEASGRPRGDDGALVLTNAVTPAYFSTVGIPLRRGRSFHDTDREGTPDVAVVNETMARNLWPGQEPVGRRFQAEDRTLTVVGVAADSKYVSLTEETQPCFYLPLAQWTRPEVILHLRTLSRPEPFVGAVRRELRSIDPDLTLYDVRTMEDTLSVSLWAQRLGTALLALFAILALTLAVTGVHAVLSYSVNQRLREVGIRTALGARRTEILRLLVGRAMGAVGLGLGLGLAAAAAGGRLVSNLLYGIRPADPATFVQVAGTLAAIALVTSCTAARRAMRVHPAQALSWE